MSSSFEPAPRDDPAEAAAVPLIAPADLEPVPEGPASELGRLAASAGIRRVQMIAWRDLDHPEAGGSEVHAARIAERWAGSGIDVVLTTSRSPGRPDLARSDGYLVERPAGRYAIFPVALARAVTRRQPRPDATVEFWNGMPFWTPLWPRSRRLVFLHHVHGGMWDLVLPPALAATGRFIERRGAPPFYRRTPIATLSESSRAEIIATLGMDPNRVTVVAPGVDDAFEPGGHKSDEPLVVAVGRLVTYKRFDRLIRVLLDLKRRHPGLRACIAGEGAERGRLEGLVRAGGAGGWLHLPGRVSEAELVDLYRRAWVLAAPSEFEGWGLTITEAAACATPAVATPIAGHRDAVVDGVTGFLAEAGRAMTERLDLLISDTLLRRRMQMAALDRARLLTWDRTALDAMRLLAGP